MYFKITYSNGFCGCDEEDFIIADCEEDAWQWFEDNVDKYGFYDDERMLDETLFEENDGGDYNTDAAWEAYWEDIRAYSNIVEITEEEYNKGLEGQI